MSVEKLASEILDIYAERVSAAYGMSTIKYADLDEEEQIKKANKTLLGQAEQSVDQFAGKPAREEGMLTYKPEPGGLMNMKYGPDLRANLLKGLLVGGLGGGGIGLLRALFGKGDKSLKDFLRNILVGGLGGAALGGAANTFLSDSWKRDSFDEKGNTIPGTDFRSLLGMKNNPVAPPVKGDPTSIVPTNAKPSLPPGQSAPAPGVIPSASPTDKRVDLAGVQLPVLDGDKSDLAHHEGSNSYLELTDNTSSPTGRIFEKSQDYGPLDHLYRAPFVLGGAGVGAVKGPDIFRRTVRYNMPSAFSDYRDNVDSLAGLNSRGDYHLKNPGSSDAGERGTPIHNTNIDLRARDKMMDLGLISEPGNYREQYDADPKNPYIKVKDINSEGVGFSKAHKPEGRIMSNRLIRGLPPVQQLQLQKIEEALVQGQLPNSVPYPSRLTTQDDLMNLLSSSEVKGVTQGIQSYEKPTILDKLTGRARGTPPTTKPEVASGIDNLKSINKSIGKAEAIGMRAARNAAVHPGKLRRGAGRVAGLGGGALVGSGLAKLLDPLIRGPVADSNLFPDSPMFGRFIEKQ